MQQVQLPDNNPGKSENGASYPIMEVVTLTVLMIAVTVALFPRAEAIALNMFRGSHHAQEDGQSLLWNVRGTASEGAAIELPPYELTPPALASQSDLGHDGLPRIEIVESSALDEAFSRLDLRHGSDPVGRKATGDDDWPLEDRVERDRAAGGIVPSAMATHPDGLGNEDSQGFVPSLPIQGALASSRRQSASGVLRGRTLSEASVARVLVPHDISPHGEVVRNETMIPAGTRSWVQSGKRIKLQPDPRLVRNDQFETDQKLANRPVVIDRAALPFAERPAQPHNRVAAVTGGQTERRPQEHGQAVTLDSPTPIPFSGQPERHPTLASESRTSPTNWDDQEPVVRRPMSAPVMQGVNDFQPRQQTR